jgi:Camelysin metallo-endopeptidase
MLETKSPQRKRDKARIFFAVALLLGSIGASFSLTGALYTDVETVDNNTFTVGTLDISASPATALFTAPAMAPGDSVTAELTVTNAGTLDLRYAAESETDEDVLSAQLVLTIKSGVTTCDNTDWDSDGTALYTGILGSTSVETLFGDKTAGADAGDRTLAPSASEDLCFHVELPITAPDASQGVTTTAAFTLYAEQTVNNP